MQFLDDTTLHVYTYIHTYIQKYYINARSGRHALTFSQSQHLPTTDAYRTNSGGTIVRYTSHQVGISVLILHIQYRKRKVKVCALLPSGACRQLNFTHIRAILNKFVYYRQRSATTTHITKNELILDHFGGLFCQQVCMLSTNVCFD